MVFYRIFGQKENSVKNIWDNANGIQLTKMWSTINKKHFWGKRSFSKKYFFSRKQLRLTPIPMGLKLKNKLKKWWTINNKSQVLSSPQCDSQCSVKIAKYHKHEQKYSWSKWTYSKKSCDKVWVPPVWHKMREKSEKVIQNL